MEERILPWLKKSWPAAKEKQNERTSVAMAQMVINSGHAFPTILEWARQYLSPSQQVSRLDGRSREWYVCIRRAEISRPLRATPGLEFPRNRSESVPAHPREERQTAQVDVEARPFMA